jgi:hypothetical protein
MTAKEHADMASRLADVASSDAQGNGAYYAAQAQAHGLAALAIAFTDHMRVTIEGDD